MLKVNHLYQPGTQGQVPSGDAVIDYRRGGKARSIRLRGREAALGRSPGPRQSRDEVTAVRPISPCRLALREACVGDHRSQESHRGAIVGRMSRGAPTRSRTISGKYVPDVRRPTLARWIDAVVCLTQDDPRRGTDSVTCPVSDARQQGRGASHIGCSSQARRSGRSIGKKDRSRATFTWILRLRLLVPGLAQLNWGQQRAWARFSALVPVRPGRERLLLGNLDGLGRSWPSPS